MRAVIQKVIYAMTVLHISTGTESSFADEIETAPPSEALPANSEAQTALGDPASTAPAALPGEAVLKLRAKGKGIALAKVEVKLDGKLFFTDPQGEVRLQIPAEGDGKVEIFRKGYERLEVPFSELRPAGEFDIFLYPAVSNENVVVVTGKKRPQVSRKTVSIQESRKIAPGGDPAQVVRLLPGVQSQGFSSEVVVRGSGPRDSRYYIDDFEVPFIFHGIGNLSVVQPGLMSEVDFDAGGFGAEYGDATGGIITIRTTNEVPERPLTELLVNIPFYSGVFHTRPVAEDASLSVSIRRSYAEFFVQKVLDSQFAEDSGGVTLVPYFGDAHAVYLKKHESGHSKFSLLAAYDGVKAQIPADSFANEDGYANIEFRTSFVNAGVEHLSRINRDWKYTTTPQLYYFDTDANFVGNTFGNTVTNLRAPTTFARRISKNEELIVGIDPIFAEAKVKVNAIDFRPGDPTFDPEDAPRRTLTKTYMRQTHAAWTAIDQEFGPVILTPGIRAFYDSFITESGFDPRLSSRYTVTESSLLKAAVGQYSQTPEPQVSTRDFGNPNLDFVRSLHYVLGLETRWGDDWTTELQGFYKATKNIITPDPDLRYDNDGSSRSRGAEVFIRRNLTGRVFGWLSYTYSKTEERESDDQPFRDSQYDQTHVVNAVASYRLSGTWELGTRYNHHTGETYTPVTDAVYNANLDKYRRRDDPRNDYSKRLPEYNSLTLYLTKDVLFDTWKLAFKFGMESYWPEEQVLGMGNNYDFSKEQPQNGLTAIPFIEVRGEL
jgi:hypothetical protein